jgi:hypothetical protein
MSSALRAFDFIEMQLPSCSIFKFIVFLVVVDHVVVLVILQTQQGEREEV